MSTKSKQEAKLELFVRKLNCQDRERYLSTTVDDVLLTSQILLSKRSTCSRTLRLCVKLDPIVQFLQHYAKGIDIMVQQSGPVALAWGCIRVLLESVNLHTSFIAFLISTIEDISDNLRILHQYNEIYSHWEPFRTSLTDVYYHIVVFLLRVDRTLRTSKEHSQWQSEKDIQDSISAIKRHTKLLENEKELLHHRLAYQENRKRLMNWLSPADAMQDLTREREKRTHGTCQWILRNETYVNWKSNQNKDQVLWISGPAGSGKTVLFASIVEDLQLSLPDASVAHFFFGFSTDKSDTLHAMITIMSQMIAKQTTITPELFSAFDNATRYGRNRLSWADEPMKIIHHILQSQKMSYLVLDGIDECVDLENTIQKFLSLIDSPNVRILITSRDVPEIRHHVSHRTTINLSTADTKNDIDLYIRTELTKITQSLDEVNLIESVLPNLQATADGSFLWAYLMLETLRKATNAMEFVSLSKILPQDLRSAYNLEIQRMDKISTLTSHLGKDLLCWICFSRRPMKWKELEYALSFSLDFTEACINRRPFKSSVLRLCNPLIHYDALTDEFRLLHWSVCEYMSPKNDSDFFSHKELPPGLISEQAHSIILQTCVQCLNREHSPGKEISEQTPLGLYATLHWCYHLTQASMSDRVKQAIENFICHSGHRKAWVAEYIRLQITAFPLQAVLKQLRDVSAWLSHASGRARSFDILHETLDTIHFIAVEYSHPHLRPGMQCPPGHFDTMMAIRDLARAYTHANRLSDAVSWLEKALVNVEGGDPEADRKRVWILNSLGIVYDQQDLFEKAAETQMQALALQRFWLEEDHMEIVWTKNELGRVYRHLWRLSDAEKMLSDTLAVLQKQFNESDAQVVWTKATLARTYRFQGQFRKSLELHQQTLDVQIRTLGATHCHTLWTLSDIARCLRDQGKLVEAYETFMRVVEGRSDTLGDQHPDTLWSLNDVGMVLTKLGKCQEARKFHEKAWKGQSECLGEYHKQTKWSECVLKQLER